MLSAARLVGKESAVNIEHHDLGLAGAVRQVQVHLGIEVCQEACGVVEVVHEALFFEQEHAFWTSSSVSCAFF